jgi:hypothetical protein
MNKNPIVLYIDADNNHSFLSYTQDPDKISRNINHFGAEYARDIEIRKSIYALSDDFFYKLEYLKSHSSRSFYPVLLSSDIS